MQIIPQNNNVHFGARLIGSASIKVKNAANKWVQEPVNLIKLETNKTADLGVLDSVDYLWSGRNLSGSIAEEAHIMGGGTGIYALTRQQNGFDRIKPLDILGIMSTNSLYKTKPDSVEIFKIGTKPLYAYEQNHRQRDVKNVAKTMVKKFVEHLKKDTKAGSVVVHADPGDVKFLSRIGMKESGSTPLVPRFELKRADFDSFVG